MPTFHYKCFITHKPDNISKNNHIRHGHEYSVWFARLRFYPTNSLCLKSVNSHGMVHCACMNICYNQATQLITHVAASKK